MTIASHKPSQDQRVFNYAMKSSISKAEKWGNSWSVTTFCLKVRNIPENRELLAFLFDVGQPAAVYYQAGKTPLSFQWCLSHEDYGDIWRLKSQKPRFN